MAAAQKLGLELVPVVVLDHLSPTQRRALVIADNRIAENAGWDDAMLRIELEALQLEGFDLDITGFDADALAELIAGDEPDNEGQTDEDAVPEVSETPISRPGDVWIMGPHRLLCGDATVAASYDALLQGAPVDMVFTDPPYNVNYANSAKDKMRGKDRAILNDNLGDGFYDFLLAALTPTVAHCRGGIYVAMSSSELDVLQAAFRAAGGKWSTFIIWAKNTFTLGRADYQRQYEPILYGWPEGAQRHWCGDRDQGDVWNVKKPQKNDLYPTTQVPQTALPRRGVHAGIFRLQELTTGLPLARLRPCWAHTKKSPGRNPGFLLERRCVLSGRRRRRRRDRFPSAASAPGTGRAPSWPVPNCPGWTPARS